MKQQFITPGENIIRTISAMPGGMAEKILKAITINPNGRQTRKFHPWEGDCCVGKITYEERHEFDICLKVGVKEGLFLKDENSGSSVSMKYTQNGQFYVVEIPQNLTENAFNRAVNGIIGTWVLHGKNWVNRSGQIMFQPYGLETKIIEGTRQKFFNLYPQGETPLNNLLQVAAVRRTHCGQWNRPSTLLPAVAGLVITAHEFKEDNSDVAVFNERKISDDLSNIWAGYIDWNATQNDPILFGEFTDLAQTCANPFSFHLHATKRRFSNYTLQSTWMLKNIDRDTLVQAIERIAANDPERFYRLISEKGTTLKLLRVKDDTLCFQGGVTFPIEDAVANILETFYDLNQVENEPSFCLPRRKRLVLDSHFYIVSQALTRDFGGSCHELSGGDMYGYLTCGKDAAMHQFRNNQMFMLLRDFCVTDICNFHIYPSIKDISGKNQYNYENH